MRKLIEYIVWKAVQITAIFYLPVLIYEMFNEPFSFGNMFWVGLDFAILCEFWKEMRDKTLEKEFHKESV
jgi:hypothetical protein